MKSAAVGVAMALAASIAGCGGGGTPTRDAADGGSAGTGTAGAAGGGAAGAAGTGAAGAAGGAAGGTGGASQGGSGGDGGRGGTPDAGQAGQAGQAAIDASADLPAGDGPGDAGADGAMCTPGERPALRGTPDIVILLDASGSMNEDPLGQMCMNGCGPTSKWSSMTPAINQIVATTETSVNWGLKLFADDNRCGVSPGVAVPVAPGNAIAIADAIAGRTDATGNVTSGSSTPTRLAVNAAAAYLATVQDTNPKFILLATDGQPNCATSGQNSDDSIAAITAVLDAAARGFPTFVVGIATTAGTADTVLSQMALAGGRPRMAFPEYFPVTSTNELLAALNAIVGQANECTLGIGEPPPGASRDDIAVRGDGTTIARDRSNGWDYADTTHTSIALFGAACAALRTAAIQRITIVFSCAPAG
jgi:hypothetical protein